MKKHILIIDDEQSIRDSLSDILHDEGFSAHGVGSAEEALELLDDERIDLILLDIWLGDKMDGLTALKEIKERSTIPVIMISGHGTIETAVQATQSGAFDFIEKPLSYDKIILSVNNALKFAALENENKQLRAVSGRKAQLTGNSPPLSSLKKQIEMVAPTDAWVLIRGSHGTGKELVAQAIHQQSSCAEKPMIEVNCAAIPEELIESELFGHEKGSFTGAHSSKRGKFDQAHGGILFLDEIGDMSMKTQAKILRILQEQKFERVGGNKTITVNVRVLAATNKNLEEEIENGTFRADLFWRLNVVPIVVPELRERIEDLPLLVHDLIELTVDKGLKHKTFSQEALQMMMEHTWPGNVRELRNFVERIAIMCQDEIVTRDHIQSFLFPESLSTAQNKELNPAFFQTDNFKEARKQFEQEYLQFKLSENNGNISKTAEMIGLERSHLHKKLKSLQIIN
ncbi:MAG: sigma-54-dependent Fis family transcriptional regulator [Desulfobulbaceae bacterium]|nr:MAG: sigma-54-dependent Fis family transcriptional regulator [Desulfobulbaceae bacterium]